MMPSGPSEPFALDVECDFAGFRQVLKDAGYTDNALAGTLAGGSGGAKVDVALLRRQLADPTPYNRLFLLLCLGEPLSEGGVHDLFGAPLSAQLQRTGMLRTGSDGIRAAAQLTPCRQVYAFGDFRPHDGSVALPADHVLGVGGSSSTLTNLTIHKPVGSMLDVGTGAGIQALVGASHARHVVATDISERALNFAGMNALLNGIGNIDLRAGSFFEPVHGETFDLVVSNPPFVVSPDSRFAFRDAGMAGDAVSEHIVRSMGRHLNEGGFAVALINWHHPTEDAWAERPRRWAAETGCDTWLARIDVAEPLRYAAEWLRPTEGGSPHYGKLLDEWVAYYRRNDMAAISAGVVVQRKRRGADNWVRCETMVGGRGVGDSGDHVERIFAAEDYLKAVRDDRQMLDDLFQLHPEHAIDYHLALREGEWTVGPMTLKSTRGIMFTSKIDARVMRLLAGCDGRHALRASIADVAEGLEEDFESVAPFCVDAVKTLVRAGFLQPVAPKP